MLSWWILIEFTQTAIWKNFTGSYDNTLWTALSDIWWDSCDTENRLYHSLIIHIGTWGPKAWRSSDLVICAVYIWTRAWVLSSLSDRMIRYPAPRELPGKQWALSTVFPEQQLLSTQPIRNANKVVPTDTETENIPRWFASWFHSKYVCFALCYMKNRTFGFFNEKISLKNYTLSATFENLGD